MATDDETQAHMPCTEDVQRTDEEQPAQDAELLQLPTDPPPDLAERNAGRHDWIAEGDSKSGIRSMAAIAGWLTSR
jgi:hypothetical protein